MAYENLRVSSIWSDGRVRFTFDVPPGWDGAAIVIEASELRAVFDPQTDDPIEAKGDE